MRRNPRENLLIPEGVASIQLRYWIITSGEPSGTTRFQGFGGDVVDPEFAELVAALSMLPASPVELYLPTEMLPGYRREFQTKQAWIAGLESFREIQAKIERDRAVDIVLGLPRNVLTAREQAIVHSIVWVTSRAGHDMVSLESFRGHPSQLIDTRIHEKCAALLPLEERKKLLRTPLRKTPSSHDEESISGGVTIPNETLCQALGRSCKVRIPIRAEDPNDLDTPYVDAIVDSVDRARQTIGSESTDIALYAPSIYRHLYDFDSAFWNAHKRAIRSKPLRRFVIKGIFNNPSYSGFAQQADCNEDIPNPYEDHEAAKILVTRQQELRLTAIAIGALAANQLQPALRLPNSVNLCTSTMKEVERYAAQDGRREKNMLQRSHNSLISQMSSRISPRILHDIERNAKAITVISDAPLEWLRIDGLPLMIRNDTSRIGMTPGNLMLHQCVKAGLTHIGPDVFEEILVIRSFSPGDHIRNFLENALRVLDCRPGRIRIVDVENSAQLVEALNDFRGALLIFDCHGGCGDAGESGWLEIGSERVNTWTLVGRARIPPIVMLSACSTFALSGSHASVANGLLRTGAITVIGTLLPIDAVLSAVFIARLIFRIEEFLPALKSLGVSSVSWRSLISTFFRMSYATDLLWYFLHEKGWITQKSMEEIGFATNVDINSLRPDWYQRLVGRIAEGSGREAAHVQATVDSEHPLFETMYYCQIGRPETIIINLNDIGSCREGKRLRLQPKRLHHN